MPLIIFFHLPACAAIVLSGHCLLSRLQQPPLEPLLQHHHHYGSTSTLQPLPIHLFASGNWGLQSPRAVLPRKEDCSHLDSLDLVFSCREQTFSGERCWTPLPDIMLLCVSPSVYCSAVCACLSVCLSVCQSVYLSVCLSVCQPVCLSVYLSICLFVCQPVCLFVCLSVCSSVYNCLSIFLSVFCGLRGLVVPGIGCPWCCWKSLH